MKISNYLNLNKRPVQLSLYKNRTESFREIFHSHQGMEFLYVHEGSGRVVTEQQLYDVVPGTLLCFRPYQMHRVSMITGANQPYIRSMFTFEPQILAQYLQPFPSIHHFLHYLWKSSQAVLKIRLSQPKEMEQFLQIYTNRFSGTFHEDNTVPRGSGTPLSFETPTESESASHRDTEESAAFMLSFLHYIKPLWMKEDRVQSKSSSSPSSSVSAMLQWIEHNYAREFRLTDLAAAVHLSPNHVSYQFRQETGCSITEYLTATRINRACWLLRSTSLTVREIGLQTGIGNFSYFCQLFKRETGTTPLQYRSLG